MKKNEKHAITATGLIIIAFVAAAQMGWLAQYGVGPLFNQAPPGGTTPTVPQSDYSKGIGKFQLDFKCAKTLDSSALAFGTDLDAWALHYVNGAYSAEGAAYDPSKTQYFTATAADNGIMYIEIKPHSTTYYIDYNTIMTREGGVGYVKGVSYISDPLADGHKDFIFQFDLKGQTVPNSGFPIASFTAWAIAYESSLPALTSPGNFSEIELVSVPKYAEWDVTFVAAGNAIAVYQIELIFGNATNTVTDQGKAQIKSMSFPGLGTIDGQSFGNPQFTTQDIRYSYSFATSLYGADYILLLANQNNKFPINVQFQFLLSSAEEIPIRLLIRYYDNAGAGQSISSDISANEASGTTGAA
jgi:hypothetical protein